MSLAANAASMGLIEHAERRDMFSYSDRYGDVLYRQIKTFGTPQNAYITVDPIQTDDMELEHYAVFAKQPTAENFHFCGIVSRIYRFEGHEKLNNLIRESIQTNGQAIINEKSWFPESVVIMRTEFIIQSAVNTPEVGDLYPTIICYNTYNGTGAQGVSYGISISEENAFKSFSFDLGSIKSIHTFGAKTRIQSTTSSYIQVFSENIGEMIRQNFSTPLTEDMTFKTLDFIEKIGKKKRVEVSKFLEDIMQTNESGVRRTATAWEMFLAILRTSTLTGNINVKRLLESAAERVLVLPDRMAEALKSL